MQHKINLREERDFGQKINAVFTFLQQNFKPLFKSLLFIAGPVALLAGICMGIYQSRIMNIASDSSLISPTSPLREIFSPAYISGLVLILLSFVLVYLVVFSYLKEYLIDKNQEITTDLIWKNVKEKLFTSIITMIVVGIIIVIGCIVLVIPGIYLSVPLQLALIIIMIENAGISNSINRCFYLTSGKWWSTFGLIFIMLIIQSVLSLVFQIPSYVVMLSKLFHLGASSTDSVDIFMILGTIFSSVGSVLLYSLSALAIAFQYFNLVERKDGVGLLEEVEQIGKPHSVSDNEGDF
ncbi:hypothetical protein [Solitalea lacus]|uniref:hypothetical protein n=1 Tax=Solitalea lacus TaxID=2911172 RepID=UPI001EDB988C|nr:hypothetical protein [Solitalea lacus]UKJ08172.1 hypothetical protein L2B55_03140 [Solitalea lacus]